MPLNPESSKGRLLSISNTVKKKTVEHTVRRKYISNPDSNQTTDNTAPPAGRAISDNTRIAKNARSLLLFISTRRSNLGNCSRQESGHSKDVLGQTALETDFSAQNEDQDFSDLAVSSPAASLEEAYSACVVRL